MFPTVQDLPVPPALRAPHPAPAHVRYADPADEARQLTDLQRRAEAYVAGLRSDAEVFEFEQERAVERAEAGLPPVPLTRRGRRAVAQAGYRVDGQGYLVLD